MYSSIAVKAPGEISVEFLANGTFVKRVLLSFSFSLNSILISLVGPSTHGQIAFFVSSDMIKSE